MALIESLIIISGLIVFEIVMSLDNAIVNAHVLKKMSSLWRRRFLTIGIFSSVFLVRFLLPLAIIWLSVQNLSISEFFQSFIGGNELGLKAIESSKPFILIFGGVFLIYLYLHWLFVEKKQHKLFFEKILKTKHDIWFFLILVPIVLAVIIFLVKSNATMMLAAVVGSITFFALYWIKAKAEKRENKLIHKSGLGDFSKFIYLNFLDATFSFDGVIGAFAFTINLLLIVIGLGIGAWIVRALTIKGMNLVVRYRFLKNGAMTSIGFLGLFMIIESFGIELPSFIPTAITFLLVGIAFYKSHNFLTNKKK